MCACVCVCWSALSFGGCDIRLVRARVGSADILSYLQLRSCQGSNVASTARSSYLLLGSSVETLRHSVSVVSVSIASA